jgi:hypothetical protein
MYIEIHNIEINQEALYFKLNSAFSIDSSDGLTHKINGVYAIYLNDICLYVGQSKNLASRIATHLSGKYKESTSIFLWDVEDIGFSNFHKRSKESQTDILNNCEIYLMKFLKPIENININMSAILSDNESPNITYENGASLTIKKENNLIVVTSDYSIIFDYISVDYSINEDSREIYNHLSELYNKTIPSFGDKQND